MSLLIERSKQRIWHVLGERELFEAILGPVVVMMVGRYLPTAWLSSHLIFCTFFCVVFAVAVRYQARAAYSAGFLAALGYSALCWMRPEIRAQAGMVQFTLEPFLLVMSAVVSSDLLRGQRRRLHLLERKSARAEAALQGATRRYQAALAINKELEEQVVGQSVSLAMISEKVSLLWHLSGKGFYDALLDLVVQAVGAQTCALYLPRDGQWRLSTELSICEFKCTPLLCSDDPLLQRIISRGQSCAIDESLLEGEALAQQTTLLAGPLCDRAGEIVGLIAIENIPLLKFTPGALRLFDALLRMASLALQGPSNGGDVF